MKVCTLARASKLPEWVALIDTSNQIPMQFSYCTQFRPHHRELIDIMWFFTGLFALYCAATWHSLQQAASPAVPCRGEPCLHPFIFAEDSLSLGLWIRNESSWVPVESCQFNFTLPQINTLPKLLTANKTNCTVDIPAFARRRSPHQQEVQPLEAKFLFHHGNRVPVASAFFHLTRISKQSSSNAFWSSSGSKDGSKPRNLLEKPTVEDESKPATPSSSKTMYVPYFKYYRSPIRLRFVAEERSYGSRHRRDGFMLQIWNRTAFAPHFYVDELSLQRGTQAQLAEPQDEKPPVRLDIKINSLSPLLHSLNQQFAQGFQMVEPMLPGEELDEIRYFLSDERLYRFILTQIISYVHVWLDYMAFRDEIRFYRGKKSFSGVSASSVITRLACSIIIFLYLLDGGGTSWVVLLSMFASCAIEAWKVWKLLRPKLKGTYPFISIRQLATENEIKTAEYDRTAIKYLSLVLYPLVIAWSIYALQHYEYRSWYSFVITNLANAVYTFGFIGLCPQLYVNYKLKSVAHLPWKVFMYKIFNTFVDDAFAFLIDMPWKHRIMTLRDDVVFLLFLVQCYLYRVDKSRTNEYGYAYGGSSEDPGDTSKQSLANITTPSIDGKLKEE